MDKPIEAEQLAIVKYTSAGPSLFIAGVEVRSWIGVTYNDMASNLARAVNTAISKQSDKLTIQQATFQQTSSHGSRELDEDATKLQSLGFDPGPTLSDLGLD